MKPKFKKLIQAIVFVLIPILLWNCSTEEIAVKNNEAATKTFLEEINQAKLSLDELKKDERINTILNDAFKGIKQNNPYQKNQNNLQKIELSNAVTKFSRFDYTSYTIPILNRAQNHNSFQNIVIETDNLRDAAYLVTYFPNKNYQKAKNAQNISEDQTIYYIASSKIEYLYYKRKINTFPNNPSTQKTASSINPLIEESLVICVTTYTPGHNCTAGGNDAVGESCSGVGSERATGPVVSESCTNIPEAPPTFPNDPPAGGGIGPDDSSYGSGGGMILLPIDPLADYPKKWICMNPPSCTELIPYTPIITLPLDDPYNFYSGILSYDQINTLLRFEYSDVKKDIDNFLLQNENENESYSIEVKEFAAEIISYLIANPNKTFDDVFYNRTSFDANSAIDIDNNTDGGYDTNTYVGFNPQQTWSNISPIIPTNQFVGWGAPGIKRNCMDYAKAQIAKKGYQISNYGSSGQTFQIYTEQNGANQTNLAKGLAYLKYALSNNIPVIVGIDDNPGDPGNPDNSTDHFIVIVGMGSNSKGNYFQFYDNASSNTKEGTSSLNLLYYNPTTSTISGASQCSGYFSSVAHDYVITQIRKSKIKL